METPAPASEGGRGWGEERPHGRQLSAEGSQQEAVFCGQSQALVITVAPVTRVSETLQMAPFHLFSNCQQLETVWINKNSSE